MAQYLIAQWDYTAEGNYELSFKEGDKIKLLEKHNDDWWEGELNDEIGFFPANRTTAFNEEFAKVSPPSSTANHHATTIPDNRNNEHTNSAVEHKKVPPPEQLQRPSALKSTQSNPYLQHQQQQQQPSLDARETVSAPTLPDTAKSNILVDVLTESDLNDLPPGWLYAHDDSGTIYFFNKNTGKSQWERPDKDDEGKLKVEKEEESLNDLIYNVRKLNLDALHPNWIRTQSIIQMKIISEQGPNMPWKEYYGVLATGFILIYKENLNKTSRRPSSMKAIPPYGSINLYNSKVIPATKSDTRKKNAFIIENNDLKIFISVANENLYSEWLDSIMRELIASKEDAENQDMELIQLLDSIPLSDKISTAKVDSVENPANAEETKSSLTRWFSRSSRNGANSKQNSSTETSQQSKEILFGGTLKLQEDGSVPQIVRQCVEEVDKRGLDVVGIYRLSGQSTSIQKYKNLYNTNPSEVDLSEENDINVITGLLKLYFRELKNPLLTFEYYDRFIEAARLQDHDERMFRLKSIIQVLPITNYKVFQYLVRHLERVKDHSAVNKMEASNLALIFSIGLLRSKQDDLSSSILHNDLLSKVIETVIRHVDWFFDTDTDDELLIEDTSSSINNVL